VPALHRREALGLVVRAQHRVQGQDRDRVRGVEALVPPLLVVRVLRHELVLAVEPGATERVRVQLLVVLVPQRVAGAGGARVLLRLLERRRGGVGFVRGPQRALQTTHARLDLVLAGQEDQDAAGRQLAVDLARLLHLWAERAGSGQSEHKSRVRGG
jgi:hypothetical protein